MKQELNTVLEDIKSLFFILSSFLMSVRVEKTWQQTGDSCIYNFAFSVCLIFFVILKRCLSFIVMWIIEEKLSRKSVNESVALELPSQLGL